MSADFLAAVLMAATAMSMVDEEIILLHGIIKKTRIAPRQELASLGKAAAALGRKVELRFVPA